MQPGTGGGLLRGRGTPYQLGDHEPVGGAAGLPGPGQRGVDAALPAAAAQPQRQRALDPGLHGQGRRGPRGVGAAPHPAAHGGRPHRLPIAAAPPRRQRVRHL